MRLARDVGFGQRKEEEKGRLERRLSWKGLTEWKPGERGMEDECWSECYWHVSSPLGRIYSQIRIWGLFLGLFVFLSLRAHTSHLSLARARFLPHACALSPKHVFFSSKFLKRLGPLSLSKNSSWNSFLERVGGKCVFHAPQHVLCMCVLFLMAG